MSLEAPEGLEGQGLPHCLHHLCSLVGQLGLVLLEVPDCRVNPQHQPVPQVQGFLEYPEFLVHNNRYLVALLEVSKIEERAN